MSLLQRRLHFQSLEARQLLTVTTFTRDAITTVPRTIDARLADLDGDQDLDLVVASFIDQSLSWYQNEGGGRFSAAQTIDPTADEVRNLLVEDVDSDGDQDLIVSAKDALRVYRNADGQGHFATPRTIGVTSNYISRIVPTDLDGDADHDFVAVVQAGSTNRLTVFRNRGNASVENLVTIEMSADTGPIISSDVDRDGDQDLLIPQATFGDTILSQVLWLENADGRGAFLPLKQLASLPPGYLPRLHAADLDGDGREDFLLQRQSGELVWSEQDPTKPIFSELHALPVTSFSVIATTDWNSDGILDVIVADTQQNGLRWLPSQSDSAVPYKEVKAIDAEEAETARPLVGDLDGDGHDEFVSVGLLTVHSYRFLPVEDRFEKITIAERHRVISDAKIVDLDGDGWQDIVVSAPPDILGISIQFRRNEQGTGSFADPVELTSIELESLNDFQLADLDGDGRLDLMTSFGLQLIWQRQATDSFTFGQRQPLVNGAIDSFELVDLDKDSDLDIVALKDSSLVWLENLEGRAEFALHSIASLGGYTTSFLAVGDLDGDTNLDIVVPSDSVGIQWFQHRDGKGTFRARGVVGDLGGASYFRRVELHDMNGDGRPDLTGRTAYGARFGWLENSPSGFRPFQEFPYVVPLDPYDNDAAVVADFDRDQDLDVLFAVPQSSDTHFLTLFENQGNGQFLPAYPERLSKGKLVSSPFHLATGDLDGDQHLDLALGLFDGELSVLMSRILGDVNEDRVFDSADLLAVFQAGEYEDQLVGNSSFNEGDWDGDGEFDSNDIILAWTNGHYKSL